MPFRVCTSVVCGAREASLSVPPPVSAPQPSMCEAALTPPSIAQAVPTTAAAAPGATSPPVAAPAAPATARAPSPRAVRAPPVFTAAAVSAPAAATLLRGEPFDVLRRLALHLRRPLARSLRQGSTSLGRPII